MSAVCASVRLDVVDRVATLRIERADSGNALNPEVAGALRAAAESLVGRDDVGAVVLSTAGPAFCVGGDLRWMADQSEDRIHDALLALARDFHGALLALDAGSAPVIARVQGVAAGGGLSLVCAADIVLATPQARFTAAYTAVGLSPDGGLSWRLPRIVGSRQATELLLTNRRLNAEDALELGLISRLVDPHALDAEVAACARLLAQGAEQAQAAVRRLVQASATTTLVEQYEAEARSIAARAASPEGREGIAAFLAKRSPAFPR